MSKKLTKLDKYLLNLEWKSICIDGQTTHYEISNDGFVRNLKTNRLLAGSHDSRGYVTVSIWVNDKLYTKKVHRLVAEAFIPNPDNKPTVNHKDGNKENNSISNLEWATHQENIDHAINTGLRDLKGMKASSNIYTDEEVHVVCKMLEEGKSAKYIAKELNVNINLPRRILYSGKWEHISKLYKLPKVNKINSNIKGRAFELMSQGITEYNELIKLLDLPDNDTSKNYLYSLKWKFKVQCSTTIDQSTVAS